MQIPLVIGYHQFMKDLTTFHIWGTVCMNQVLNVSKTLDTKYLETVSLDYTKTRCIVCDTAAAYNGR